MDRERVIVYIDENTDDGMMWEELNQEGQMQISVYDEEFECDVEYSHSIVVKSLQEYLADYTKQVRKEVIREIGRQAFLYEYLPYGVTDGVIDMVDLLKILDEIREKE